MSCLCIHSLTLFLLTRAFNLFTFKVIIDRCVHFVNSFLVVLYFLRSACIAINFPLRPAFAASHRFWSVVSLLSFASRYFLISSLIYSVIHLIVE